MPAESAEVEDEAGLKVVVGIGEGVSVAEVVRVGLSAGLRIQERPAAGWSMCARCYLLVHCVNVSFSIVIKCATPYHILQIYIHIFDTTKASYHRAGGAVGGVRRVWNSQPLLTQLHLSLLI